MRIELAQAYFGETTIDERVESVKSEARKTNDQDAR
jgi:hypothetical protein